MTNFLLSDHETNIGRKGQAIVIVLLLAAVIITVALAVISQSVTEVRTSKQSQDTVAAYSAAEAGVEAVLKSALSNGTTHLSEPVGNASFTADANQLIVDPLSHDYLMPREVYAGDAQTLWFVSHDKDGNLSCASLPCAFFPGSQTFTVYWGKNPSSDKPALLLDIYYKNPGPVGAGNPVKVARIALDHETRPIADCFSSAVSTNANAAGINFPYYATIDLTAFPPYPCGTPSQTRLPAGIATTADSIQFIRVRILYAQNDSHPVAFKLANVANFPAQGFEPTSTGTLGSSATIKLTSKYPYPDFPPEFDYAVFTATGSITK
jgi:hypothetical protein